MKIGIFTFHCAHNFGAVLQAYALQTYLRNQGHESYIIDYRPNYLVRGYRKFSIYNWVSKNPINWFRKVVTEPFLIKDRFTKWNKFNDFISKSLNLYPFEKINNDKKFDLFLFGSDQIWNSKLMGGEWDAVYFGKGLGSKCCSYAASMGWDNVDEDRINIFKSLMAHLSAISVREETLCKSLNLISDQTIHWVCDPVFLLSMEDWAAKVHPIKNIKPYVLCFNLLHSEECMKQAQIVSYNLGYELIEITGDVHHLRGNYKVLQDIGPIDFISYIASASFVVTSSFHGTAFSIIFKKSFYSIGMGDKSGRVSSLLSIVELEHRLLNKAIDNVETMSPLDFPQEGLIRYVENSKSFLIEQCLN